MLNAFKITSLALGCLISINIQADWTKTYDEVKQSVAIVNHAGGICSGALVSPNTTITAAHCVDGLYTPYVYYKGLERKAATVYLSSSSDIAILKHAAVTDVTPIKIFSTDTKVKVGSMLATIGHPNVGGAFANPPFDDDYTFLLSQGVLSKNTKKEIISDMSLSPGNSGGPVFEESGKLVGVVSRKRIDMGVGNIGFSANHVQAANAIEESKNKISQLPFYRARTKFISAITVNSLSSNNNTFSSFRDQTTLFNFDLGFSFFNRLNLTTKLLLNSPTNINSFNEYRLSYRFALPMANRSQLFFSPVFSNLSVNNSSVTGTGLRISHSQLPIAISYVQYEDDNTLGKLSALEFTFGTGF